MGTGDLTSGKRGKALDFDGISDYLEVPVRADIDGSTAFTIEMWIKLDTLGRDHRLFGCFISGFKILYWIGTNNKLSIGVSNDGNVPPYVYSTITIPDTEWHFISVTFNAGDINFYIDDVSAGSGTTDNFVYTSGAEYNIARLNGETHTTRYFQGIMDEVMLFNRSLSQDEILSLYNNSQYRLNAKISNLAEGTYNYSVYAIDEPGNLNISSPDRQVIVDTTNPNATLLTPSNNTYIGTNETNLTANVSDTNLDNATIYVYNSTGLYNSTTTILSEISETISNFLQNLADGVYTWFVTLWDSAGNSETTANQTFTIDTTFPLIDYGIGTEANNSYKSQTFIYVNVSVTETNEGTITFDLYNGSGKWNSTSYTTSIREINFTNLAEGIYHYNVTVNDTFGNENSTGTRKITLDTTFPLISFVSPTPDNDSERSDEFEINVSITETNLENITYNWNGTETIYNISDSELIDLGNGNYLFNLTQTNLITGNTYTYSVAVSDKAGNPNSTETRTIIGNSAPTFISITHTPTSLAELDPNVLINITANISDLDNNFDSAILQWKNTSINWSSAENISMNNLTQKSITNLLNANFTPNYESNYSYRIIANDTEASTSTSSIKNISVLWDCSWTVTSDLGATAGYDEIKEIGNITINNTGDILFTNNNCSLDFRLTHNLEEGRIYYDGEDIKNLLLINNPLTPGQNMSVNLHAEFLKEIKQEDAIITLDEFRQRSETRYRNATAILVSNQAGPYIYQKITSSPNSVYLTPGNFSLKSYLRNLMGSPVINENNTAYNVSFNWTLDSEFTNLSGNLKTNFSNITDNELHYNNLNVSFSNLASMTSGIKTFEISVSGYNSSGDLIKDANNQTLLTEQVNITFLCYNVSDNVTITSCGSLDGDYKAPVITTPGTGGGGGGGGGGAVVSTEYEKSEASFELLRGEEQEFNLNIENKFQSTKENMKLSVSGINSEYIKIIPNEISKIPKKSSKNITIKITAPVYFTKGKYQLEFLIEGELVYNITRKPFKEKKTVTLYIVEVSREKADEMLNNSQIMIEKMNYSNMSIKEIYLYFEEANKFYKEINFLGVKNNYEKIKEIYDMAFDSFEMINNLKKNIEKSEKNGIDVTETKKILYVAEMAFNRGDYVLASERLKQAELTYALEVKREFNIYYAVKNNPLEALIILISLSVFSFGSSLTIRLRMYKKRFKLLQEEEKLLLELMGVVQKECFEKKHMSMNEYSEAMNQYEKKLSNTIKKKIETRTKITNLLKIKGKKRALFEEKKKLIELMKELQNKYLNKGKIETRIYENMMKSYSTRVIDIEEKIALLKVRKTLKLSKVRGFK